MKYYLFDQQPTLDQHLAEFRSLPLSFESTDNIPNRIITSPIPFSADEPNVYDFSFLFHYKIFPSHILNFYGEWQVDNHEMKEGDIIIQQIHIPPTDLSLKIVFGVKVLSVFKEDNRLGFSYGTLKGHPETGVNEFSFFRKNKQLFAQISTTAKPGRFISKILAPIFTRPYVNYCNNQALELMKENFLKSNAKSKY